jgi:glucan biosynthesis protein C
LAFRPRPDLRGWLETLTPELQRRCGLAAAITALAMPAILHAGDFFSGEAAEDRFAGGWHWQAGAASFTEGVLATCVSLWAVGYFRHHHNHPRPLTRRMAPAAYGAFIVHPPVLVGLALAIQPAPVPAELKFVSVLAGGIACSFGLAALGGRVGPIARVIGAGPRPAAQIPRTLRAMEVVR